MPFTSDDFFGVFALYNRRFIVVAVALWLASAGMVAFVSRDPGVYWYHPHRSVTPNGL